MKKTNLKWIPAVILASAILLSACSASSDKSAAATATYNMAADGGTYYDEYEMPQTAGAEYATETAEGGVYAGEMDTEGSVTIPKLDTTNMPTNKKIIRNGDMTVRAKDVQACYNSFLAYVQQNGGYEFTKDMTSDQNYIRIYATIKVSPDKLNDVMQYAGECGEVTAANVSATDITDSYTDTEIRLKSLKKTLDKYYEFFDKAETSTEMMEIQYKIDSLTAEIESYEGRIKLWNSQISESTLNISIYQKQDPISTEPEKIDWKTMKFSDMITYMGNGFKTVINTIVSIFMWILIAIVTLSPLWVPALIIILIIRGVLKKKKAAAAAKKAETEVNTEKTETTAEEKTDIGQNK